MDDWTYEVLIRVDRAVYLDYLNWLEDHIQGNASMDIPGMMEVHDDGQIIFPSVSVFVADQHDSYCYVKIIYYAVNESLIDHYLEEHAPRMRAELPDKFKGKLAYIRYRGLNGSRTLIGENHDGLGEEIAGLEHTMHNYASYEVFE